MLLLPLRLATLLLLLAVPAAHCWGAAGHQIVAVIAQIHLFPTVRDRVREILPPWTGGDLAPIAAWADRIRYALPWSRELHYVSPLDDYPPVTCCNLQSGWRHDRNVLSAIANYSSRLVDQRTSGDEDLRFLVHFIGDLHQPLHLVERERGGNGDQVRWEGRHINLHSLWDSALISRALRDLRNYTQPLPSRQIEDVLRGSIYDNYVRWIIWEGLRLWWRHDISQWLNCSSPVQLGSLTTISLWRQQLPFIEQQHDTFSVGACPTQWALPVHRLACSHVFPPDLAGADSDTLPDLSTSAYYQKIKDDKVVERLLAMAGLRLAAALNVLLGSDSAVVKADRWPVAIDWLSTHQP